MSRAIAGAAGWPGDPKLAEKCRLLAHALLGRNANRNDFFDSGQAAFFGDCFCAPFAGPSSQFDPNLCIAGDVRIDNRDAFIDRCALARDQAAGLSDIGLLALGWTRREERIFDALVGPYALAIWCGRGQRLILARDPQGLRPLFFHRHSDWVAFASLPIALAALPEIGRRLNQQRMLDMLLLVDQQGEPSFFEGIEAVRKGEIVCFDGPARVNRRQFWDAHQIATERRSPDEHAEGLRDCLAEAVRSAVNTPQTLATTLSGGFDSSAVTSLAAKFLQGNDRALLAYTGVPAINDAPSLHEGWMDDEGELAAAVVRQHPNIRHRRVSPQTASLQPLFDFFFDHVGAPCLSPAVFSWHREIHFQACADGAGVLLTATGGNWTISYHAVPFLLQLAEQGRWMALFFWLRRLRGGHPALHRGNLLRKVLKRRIGEAGWERLRRLAGKRPVQAWAQAPPAWSPVAPDRFPEFLAGIDRNAPQFEVLHGGVGRSSDRRTWLMRETALPLYEKAVWLQHGLDIRDPTMDRRVVEFCLSIPDEEFLRGGKARAVFRRAFGQDVPPEILANDRIGRQGYGWYQNLKRSAGAFRDEIDRVPEASPARELFDLAGLGKLTESMAAQDDGSMETDIAYNRKLTRGMSALHFTNRMGPGN